MIRLIVKFGLIAAAAALFAWLADRPGQLRVDWLGYEVEISVLGALLLALAVMLSLATVYCQFHYAVDALAGALVALVVWTLRGRILGVPEGGIET